MLPKTARGRLARRAGFWLVALSFWVALFATVPRAFAAEKFSFDVWPVQDGYTVTAIVQSHDGYLWLGTYHGLVRFDGVRFVVFDSGNTAGLRNGVITSLYEDASGVLWIGHETGELTRLAEGNFQPVNLGTNWPGGSVEALSTDEQGDLWLLNDTGLLFRLRDGKSAECPGGASPSRKAALTRDRRGKLWVASNGLVATLEQGSFVPQQFDAAAGTEFYEKVLPAEDGAVWVLSGGRLRKWGGANWVTELTGCPPEPGAVTVLLETRGGTLLAGTLKDGLYLLRPDAAAVHFSRTNGLSHDWVRALREDHEGNIWIGTGGALDMLRPRKVKMLNPPGNWEGCAVLSFVVRTNGSAWIGTEGAGLYRYRQDGSWSCFRESSGLSNSFVWSVLETRGGRLFAGTWGGGLVALNGARFEVPDGLDKLSAPVAALYEGKQGELWIGTTTGLHRYEHGKLVWSAGKDKLTLPDVRAITQTSDGTLWFGMSGGGLGRLKDGVLQQFRKADGLGSDFVICLYADPSGTLWFGTADHGLGRWRQGKLGSISAEQGLPSNVICHIVDDGAGNLWMGSHRGILHASKADLDRCVEGATKTLHCLSYGLAEGLASLTCSGGFQPGACRTRDGSLWFPTAKGLAIVEPANVTTNLVPPPVAIEEVLIDGTNITAWSEASARPGTVGPAAGTGTKDGRSARLIRITPGRQRFEFHYTGLSFVSPDKVRFRYQLEGLETDWQEAGTKRVAQYSYLRPGTYRFHVKACNNDGVWNEAGATLAFAVMPFFWQTWWFQAAAVLAGGGAIGAGVLWGSRRRLRHKLEQLERQRALERERARIARDIHDDLGASLTRITMLCQSARGELEGHHQAAADVDQIYGTARELTRAMDEIVWAVNPKHDTLDSLVTYLGRYAQNFLSAAAIRCRLDVPLHLPAWALTAEIRHHVFLAFKEALNNVVKHALATEVGVSLELLPNGFVLMIKDNGHGFEFPSPAARPFAAGEHARVAPGNGLLNMRKRLEEIGGRCEWQTAPGDGTRVKLAITAVN
jgi:ligand-binding sensor domain-containing protein/signal transduction histidine kinase